MIQITQQLTGFAKKLETLTDTNEVMEWARTTPGMSFTIAAQANGDEIRMQFEGTNIATVYPEFGKWLVFNGVQAEVLDDEEYSDRGYAEA